MTVYTYAELEGLWISAGGNRALAPVMAAIAEAESGGNSDAWNPRDTNGLPSGGLWQINPAPANWADPAANARDAVAKYKSQGLGAWGTYTSGAYKGYLSNKTTPATNVQGSPSAKQAQTVAAGASDCIIANPASVSLPLIGSLSAGPSCLFSRSNARAIVGGVMVVSAGVLGLAALAVLAVGVGMKAIGPAAAAAEKAGGVLMVVPGAQGAGAALAGAGRSARSGRARQSRGAREDAQLEAMVGEPRENPDLEVRGGAVRESAGDRAARRRREQAASRARARRSAGQGRPASREEAGF